MPQYYTRVIVHGIIPAKDSQEALHLMAERIRQGIGPDPENGHREMEISVAAGAASTGDDTDHIMMVNQDFLMRLQTGLHLDE